MMTAEQLVMAELQRGPLQNYPLPEQLKAALQRHCTHLIGLVASLQVAGQDAALIRAMVGDLLKSYEIDLMHVLGTEK